MLKKDVCQTVWSRDPHVNLLTYASKRMEVFKSVANLCIDLFILVMGFGQRWFSGK